MVRNIRLNGLIIGKIPYVGELDGSEFLTRVIDSTRPTCPTRDPSKTLVTAQRDGKLHYVLTWGWDGDAHLVPGRPAQRVGPLSLGNERGTDEFWALWMGPSID